MRECLESLTSKSVVDNLKPTEIVVSFSAVSRWNEPPSPSKEESKSNLKSKDRDRDSRAENLTAESSSVVDGKWKNLNSLAFWYRDAKWC